MAKDQLGGGHRDGEAELDGDAEVGVGGQHDAGVAELISDRLQVRADQQHERGRAMAKVMQPHRWQPRVCYQLVEGSGQVLGAQRPAVRCSEHVPAENGPAGLGLELLRRLGFDGLYDGFHASRTLRGAFDEGTVWPLTVFRESIFPLVEAAGSARHQLIPLLMKGNPTLRDRTISPGETKDLLAVLSKAVSSLAAVVHTGGPGSVGEALRIADSERIVELDARLRDALHEPVDAVYEALDEDQRMALSAYLQCDVREVHAYMTYLEADSPYSTQQGIKGAEFPDVLVVLDDEEGNYSLFSYDKLLKLKPLSGTDLDNAARGADTVLARTWRLFYVCASRARRALAIVLYASDVAAAVAAFRASKLPGTQNVWTLDRMQSFQPPPE